MAEQFEKHARTFGGLTLVSRVTGLVRDAALASVFGVSAYTDATPIACSTSTQAGVGTPRITTSETSNADTTQTTPRGRAFLCFYSCNE